MNADNFADFIENPSLLYQITYQDLKDLIAQYPYSANLRLLLTKKCKMEGRKDFDKQLHLTATYSLDRNHLFEQFNSEEEENESGNYHIAEDYLQLSGLDTPNESAPPPPAADANILQQGDIEFIEPDVEDLPLTVDLTPSTDETEVSSEAVSDTQIPLKDLAKMDDHKKDPSQSGENRPKKSIIFIEDLIPSKKEEQPTAPPPPPAESSTERSPTEIPDETSTESVEEASVKAPVEQAPQATEQPSVEAPIETTEQPSPQSIDEVAPPPQEVPLEITAESRPVEISADIAPAPKRSFSSWSKEAGAHRISIQYTPPPASKQEKAKDSQITAPKKKKKKEPLKAFAAKSYKLHEDLASETLAKLHVKQGNFEEAIQMYEKLCLIFPKKRTFFAEQIEKLKKL